MSKKVFWCKNCLNMSTRPRIEFDNKCWCNACQWSEEKKNLKNCLTSIDQTQEILIALCL